MPAGAYARGRRALVQRTTWAFVELRADGLMQGFWDTATSKFNRGGVQMIRISIGILAVLMHNLACAGLGGMGSIESDEGSSSSGPVPASGIVAAIVGAVCGCLIERYLTAADLKKKGATDTTGYYLGGKVGAVIGAIAGPFIVGLLR